MINATLCTTNTNEPWAANIDFEVNGTIWTSTLDANYAHFQNLTKNNTAVIVYKTAGLEIIAKTKAKLSNPDSEGFAPVTFTVTWLRFVEAGSMQDLDEPDAIAKIINSRLHI